MQAFWDVLWADVSAFAMFAGPMLLLALPPSALGALFGAVGFGLGTWKRLVRAIVRGVLVACAAAIVLGMLFEYGFRLEGLPNARRALRESTLAPLWGSAIAVSFGTGFFAARRYAPGLLSSAPASRRFTLKQLLAVQLVAGLALGWWVFTRRDEIGSRRVELDWQIRDREAKAMFEPLGYRVHTWKELDEITLFAEWNAGQVRDDALAPVARQGSVTHLVIDTDEITDDGLRHLTAANRLRRLYIVAPQVTDDGVLALCQMPRLRYLTIESPQLTGASLASLAKVKSLRYVSLNSMLITPVEEAAFRQARPDVDLRLGAGGS